MENASDDFPQQRKLENLLPNFAGSSPPILPKTSPASLCKSRERKMRTKFFCTNFLNTPRGPGHPGKIPGTSQIPLFETQGRQTFEGGHEVFGHHPFEWKTPTPLGGLRTQKVYLRALFSCLSERRTLNPRNRERAFLNGCLGPTDRGAWRGVGRKGWQRVGTGLAKGWRRVGGGLAEGWRRVGGFPV